VTRCLPAAASVLYHGFNLWASRGPFEMCHVEGAEHTVTEHDKLP